jgi:uracil-DNA glycosylase
VRLPPQPMAAPAPVPSPPPALAPLEGVDAMDWATLRATVADCRACSLCEGRTHTVFGTGDEQADWMVVGEAPGDPEDRQGEPYLGDAGRLLDNMLRAVGRSRTGQGNQAAYVAHVLKCRPPTSRNPLPAEVALCAQYLARQVALVQPKVILAMGPLAAQALLQSQEPIGKLRGRVHQHQGIPVVVTFPPSFLLRTPINKGKAWADLCLAMEQLPR